MQRRTGRSLSTSTHDSSCILLMLVPAVPGFTRAGSCAVNRSATLAFFFAKNVYMHIRHQDMFVVIRERVAKSEVRGGAVRLLWM